ncbi:protein TOPAZ1 isoform X2 [Lepisosteus oculatus]|uniref:protein TOPAZ1 isoform X2 n=1 Tax=Lepisosteus oculatus TaxID=7918 RepID=UPI0035F52A8A
MPHPVCGRVKINRTPPSKAGDGCPSRRRWLAGGAGPPAAPSGSRAVAGGCDAAGPSALAAEPAFTAGKQQQQKEELTDVTAEECGTGTGLSGSNAAGLRDGQSRLGRVLRREGAGKNGGSGWESRAEPDASAPPSGERGGVAAVPGNGRSDAGQRDEAAEDEAPIERAGEPRSPSSEGGIRKRKKRPARLTGGRKRPRRAQSGAAAIPSPTPRALSAPDSRAGSAGPSGDQGSTGAPRKANKGVSHGEACGQVVPEKDGSSPLSSGFQSQLPKQAVSVSSERTHKRRAIKPLCCQECTKIKYKNPKVSTPVKGPSVKINTESETSKSRMKPKPCTALSEAIGKPPRISDFGINKYPILELCDIAKVLEIPVGIAAYRYVLPTELKRKNIKCFKKERRKPIWLKRGDKRCAEVYSQTNCTVPKKTTQELPDVVSGLLQKACVRSCEKRSQGSKAGCGVHEEPSVKRSKVSSGKAEDPAKSLNTRQKKQPEQCTGAAEPGASASVLTNGEVKLLSGAESPYLCLGEVTLGNLSGGLQSCPAENELKSSGYAERWDSEKSEAAGDVLPAGDYSDDPPEEELRDARKSRDPSSCQRAVPYLAWWQLSCARTYVAWPGLKAQPWAAPAPGFSEFSRSLDQTPCCLDASVDSNVAGGAAVQMTGAECEAGLRLSAECPSLQQEDDTLKGRLGSCSSLGFNTPPQASQESTVHDSSSLLMTPEGQQGAGTECSVAPSNPSTSTPDREQTVRECSHGEKEVLPGSDDSKKQELHQFSIPFQRNCVSTPLEECEPSTRVGRHPLNGGSEALQQWTMRRPAVDPCTLTSEPLPSADQKIKGPRTCLAFKTNHSASVPDVSRSSSEDEDGFEDFATLYSGEIMCEIQDACPVGPHSSVTSNPSSTSDGEPSEHMDVVRAYEQDAIVLDVIQDDPDLFGSLGEVIEAVERPRCEKKSLGIHKLRPTKAPQTGSDYKISAGNRLSVGFHTGLKSPRKKMQGNSAPTLKGVATNISSCNGGDPSEPATGLSADADCSTLKEAVAGAEGQCDDLETNASRLLGTVEAGSGQELVPAAPGSEAGSKEREEAPDGEKQQQGPAMPSAGSGATEDGFNRSKYCKFFFSATMSCYRKPCRFLHVPLQGDEKFCMEAVEMFLNTCNPDYLQRAVVVFTRYYQNSYPGVYFKSDVLQVLLSTLLRKGLFGGLFAVIQVTTTFGILPSTSLLLQVYKKVKRFGHQEAVPFLLEVTSKCVEAGLELSEDNLSFMQRQLELLQAPRQHIDVIVSMKSRALKEEEEEGEQFDIDEAIAELERCKEQEDWATLGSVFNSVCGTSGSLANLNRFCASVASALLKDLERTPLVPFCKFVETVCQEGRINELGRTLLGRIGISVMFGYHKTQQWTKGRKLLEALNGMKINFFTLKGLLGHERHVSLCQVVNVAADIYLNTGSVEGAINVLKASEWVSSSALWPCSPGDAGSRSSLLCRLADEAAGKGLLGDALDALTKLPGLQDFPVSDAPSVSQCVPVFNRLLKCCIEQHNLTVSSNAVDFMVCKKIPVNFGLLRNLIDRLGRQSLWVKARSLYKCALHLGCYPPVKENTYCRLLSVPCSLTEIEMTLAFEMFMVSNANSIQNPSTCTHALQIVLKRKEEDGSISECDYHAAVSRLVSAAQITRPKLVIKYATVNVCGEQVFTLDPLSALKWLSQNMEWAGKAWLVS